MRLTKKVKRTPIYDCDYESMVEEKGLLDKLGQLEDIEEELGIDLITLFKALNNGYWYKEYYSENGYHVVHGAGNSVKLDYALKKDGSKIWFLQQPCTYKWHYCYLDDYGEKWALTKEELK